MDTVSTYILRDVLMVMGCTWINPDTVWKFYRLLCESGTGHCVQNAAQDTVWKWTSLYGVQKVEPGHSVHVLLRTLCESGAGQRCAIGTGHCIKVEPGSLYWKWNRTTLWKWNSDTVWKSPLDTVWKWNRTVWESCWTGHGLYVEPDHCRESGTVHCVKVELYTAWKWNRTLCESGTGHCVKVEPDTVWKWNRTLCESGTGHCVKVEPDTVWKWNRTLCEGGTGHCVKVEPDTVWRWNRPREKNCDWHRSAQYSLVCTVCSEHDARISDLWWTRIATGT